MVNRSERFARLIVLFTLFTAVSFLIGCQTHSQVPTFSQITYTPTTEAAKNITALNNLLPVYEAAAAHPWKTIPSGSKLKLGAKNKNVVLLRERLRATNELVAANDSGTPVFDNPLDDAVKLFQRTHGLKADGYVGRETLRELNVSPDVRLSQIKVNLQRWEALSHRLGSRYIMVNIPDYRLNVVENGKTVLTMKAIVGNTTHQTPELQSVVTRVVLNPYWNVPKKIAKNDIVPKVIADPDYLNDERIKIFESQEPDARRIDPSEINWQSAAENGFQYHFRQEPGLGNALGLVKFEFDNSEDVYLHDTPAKTLFDQDKRAFSHGCIRLEKPFELAQYLMQNNSNWTDDRVKEILETGKTRYIKAAKPTDIVITYITASVDEYGLVEFRDDLYGRDAAPEENKITDDDTLEE